VIDDSLIMHDQRIQNCTLSNMIKCFLEW